MMSRYDSPSDRWWKNTQGGTYKFHIGTHLRDLTHLHHDQFVYFWVALFVVPHLGVLAGKKKEKSQGVMEKDGACKDSTLTLQAIKDNDGANLASTYARTDGGNKSAQLFVEIISNV